jgi:uncharacterized protein (DUF302 family)
MVANEVRMTFHMIDELIRKIDIKESSMKNISEELIEQSNRDLI